MILLLCAQHPLTALGDELQKALINATADSAVKSNDPALWDRLGKVDEENRKERMEDKKDAACKAAQDEYKSLQEKFNEECKEIGKDCKQQALSQCEAEDDGAESLASGKRDDTLAGLMNMVVKGNFGSGFMNESAMSKERLMCKGSKSIKSWKDLQKELYDDAKEARKDAKEYINELDKENGEMIDAKADASKEYAELVKEMKKLNVEIVSSTEEAKNKSGETASNLQDTLNNHLKNQLVLNKEKAMAQSALTRLYAKHMGPCIDKKAAQNLGLKGEYLAMVEQFEKDMSQLRDLRDLETKRQKLTARQKALQQWKQAQIKADFDICANNARTQYTVEYEDLTRRIELASNELVTMEGKIIQAENDLKAIPDKLAKAISALEEAKKASQEESQVKIQSLNQKMTAKLQDYQRRLIKGQTEMQKAEMDFMEKNANYQASANVAEAGLGNVIPLLSTLRRAECERQRLCSDGSSAPKLPSYCGAADSDSDFWEKTLQTDK